MKNKINLVELLKNCPSGMELDCTMFDNLYFDKVVEDCRYPIGCYTIYDGCRTSVNFTEFGEFNNYGTAKCVIFPKDRTTWEGIEAPFKDGDIVSTDDGIFTAIVRKVVECEVEDLYNHDEEYDTYCHIYYEEDDDKAYFATDATHLRFCRLANEEEKERLFQAIKDNGYKWDDENKLVRKKFDITTLKPFESKVLVRDDDCEIWRASYWGCLLEREECMYDTTRGSYAQCVPYEGNEHLLGTTHDCDKYYKNW